MVSRELLRSYPLFAGLSLDQLGILAKAANEMTVEAGHDFFREDEALNRFYLVREGEVEIVFAVPVKDAEHKISQQFSRRLKTKDVVISAVGPGEMFGWSGLVPPHKATASAKAMKSSEVIAFDCRELRKVFEEDCRFGYLMTQKAAQVIRKRLYNQRIESLANNSE